HEDERLGAIPVLREAFDDRHAEGERLARAGRGLREDVPAPDRLREDEGLDIEGFDETAGNELALDLRSHAQRPKAGRSENLTHMVVRLLVKTCSSRSHDSNSHKEEREAE